MHGVTMKFMEHCINISKQRIKEEGKLWLK